MGKLRLKWVKNFQHHSASRGCRTRIWTWTVNTNSCLQTPFWFDIMKTEDKVFYSLTTSFPSISICCHPFHHWETILISSPSTPDPRLREKRERKEEATVLQRNLKKFPEWEKVNVTVCQCEECWKKTSSANQSECIWKLKAVARVGDARVTAVCGTSSSWSR